MAARANSKPKPPTSSALRSGAKGALGELVEEAGLIATLTGGPAPVEAEASEKKVDEAKYRATYEIGRDLFEAVREMAQAENVTPSDVVRFALQVLLRDHDGDGELTEEMRRRRYQPPVRQRIR